MDTRVLRERLLLSLVVVPAVIAIVAMAVSPIVNRPIATWNWAWTAGAAAAVAGSILARQRAQGLHRFRWTMWALACAFWLGGQVAWDWYGANVPVSPNLGDIGWWLFAVAAIVGVARSPVHSRTLRAVAAAETVPLFAAALALTTAELWMHFAHSKLPDSARVAVMFYPGLYVGAAVVTLQAMISGWLRGVSSAPQRLVLVGIMLEAVTFTCWSQQLLDQTYVQGSNWLDPTFVVGLLLIAAGGAWARRSPEVARPAEQPPARAGLLPGLVFILLCVALIEAQVRHSTVEPRVILAVGLMFCGGALMLRGHLLSRRLQAMLEWERGTVADLAERESELARINRRLVEDSRHDALTGMRNRRALAHDLPRIEAHHRERGDSFAVAVCDVDHFKAYNDRLGHLAGDQALKTISAIVRTALREGDVGYRFGGEELLLVLPGTRAGEALAAVERVRAEVESAGMPHPDGNGGILTVSIGVAAGREDAAALLARADAALYEAKRGGRNRVVAATDEDDGAVVRRRRSRDEESVPRQLRSMLTVSRAAASGRGLAPVLQALAETIRLELSFEIVCVNLRDFDRDQLEVVVVLGDEEAREALLGNINPWPEFSALIKPEFERCGAIWLPAGSDLGHLQTWEPAIGDTNDPDAWHAEDMLLLPVRGADGEVLAVVSVDAPLSGRRPDDSELGVLMAVADHAGLAIERVMREHEQVAAAMRKQSTELSLAAVMLLAETLDLRDPATAKHSRTVGLFAQHTAAALGLPEERVERIHAAGVLHDLGKLGIADAILYKTGPLDDSEWREMKRHPEIGARILEHAGLTDLSRWVRSHHERVDGLGYPDRMPDAQIPLEAKILAVADAYEAMIAHRPYRRALSGEQARAELLRCSGTQFDPVVVDAFLSTLSDELDAELEELRIVA
jgi:diguanylate cyclase (GGDEF)-like protein